MKKIFNISIFMSITMFLFTSCKKDMVPNNPDVDTCDCEDIPPIEGYNMGYTYIHDSTYSFWPSLNPHNDNEFIFCESNNQGKTIYVYNSVTQEKTAIFSGNIVSAPVWGKQNDIVSTLIGGALWKMKPDGTGLTQLTTDGQYHHPKFNQTGDKIMTYHAFVDINDYYQGKIFDVQGNLIDSISYPVSKGGWFQGSTFVSAYSDILSVVDITSDEVLATYTVGNTSKTYRDVVCLNTDELIFSNIDGIFKLNIWNGTQERIQCGCSSRKYSNGSVSHDGSKILYQKTTLTPTGLQTLNERTELVWVSLDGQESLIF